MAFRRNTDKTGFGDAGLGQMGEDSTQPMHTARSELTAAAAAFGPAWSEADAEPRDWKKLALVVGLGVLSWVATYVGMLELIEANMGDLPVAHKIIIAFSVAMLMVMVVWLLDQLFAPNPLITKVFYAVGYVFLTLISIGFGFGFYWKVLESRSESSRSAESAVTQVQSSLHAASTRLDQLSTTLVQLTQISTTQSDVERAKGTSCPNSKPGDGPRRKLREDDAARFSFASEFVKGRAGQVKTELGALDAELIKISANDASLIDAKSGTRNEFMKALGRKLDLTVTGFNAFRTDPQLRQIRTDLAERAERTTFADSKGGTYACPDPQLQTALRGVVRAIDQLPDLEKPKIAAVEGSEATIEAFRRLTATFYGALSFKLPPSADELRDLQKKAVQSVEAPSLANRTVLSEAAGLSKRDYIPLAIAAFVDFCLLLVSMGRPANRLGSLVAKMREAEKGPVIQILSRFNDIHRDPAIRQNFEIFRHVVFDFNGAYYVAVPLDAPYRFKKTHSSNGIGTAQVEELQQEAHLLVNLFASFETEKIFSRVYTPLLSTKAIQKKLWRQGSKFAGCEAFRVYRFKDGAWSELILGAVMGAARRVEAEKRHRRVEDELARTFGSPASRSPAVDVRPSLKPDDLTMHAGNAPAINRTVNYATDQSARRSEYFASQPAGYQRPTPADMMPKRRNPSNDEKAPGVGEAAAAAKWGPYAPFFNTASTMPPAPRPEFLPADYTRDAFDRRQVSPSKRTLADGKAALADQSQGAHSVTPAVAEPVSLPANVTALPNIAVRQQGSIEPGTSRADLVSLSSATQIVPGRSNGDTHYILSRSETIAIPATAANLPASLLSAGFGHRSIGSAPATRTVSTELDATFADTVDPQNVVSPEASLAFGGEERQSSVVAQTQHFEVVSADEIKTLRRFAPGAAE